MPTKEETLAAREKHQGSIVEDLIVAGWEGVEAIEHDGHLLFPEQIQRVVAGGKIEVIDLLVRVPREPDFRQARLRSRKLASQYDLDPKDDKELIDNIEEMCILSIITYDPKQPGLAFDPFPEHWEKFYDTDSLTHLMTRIKELQRLVDPAPAEISEEDMLAMISAIAKVRDIRPLLVYGPVARNFFIVSMATVLENAQAERSLQESSEHSTPES